jgi:hypothetical protein
VSRIIRPVVSLRVILLLPEMSVLRFCGVGKTGEGWRDNYELKITNEKTTINKLD